MKTRTVCCLALTLASAGFLAGRQIAEVRANAGFDPDRWPHRGHGERLVEYYDPGCKASRSMHRRLEAMLATRPDIEHVLVPVSIGRGVDSTPADMLCAMDPADAWIAASKWATVGPGWSPDASIDQGRLEACAGLVEQATQHIDAEAPVVELRGVRYRGIDALPLIERAVAARGEDPNA